MARSDEEYYYAEISALSAEDRRLHDAVARDDADADAATTVQQALRDGANVNAVRNDWTPLMIACRYGYDEIIRILLDAGADAKWKHRYVGSAVSLACQHGHLSTVQLLINHDNGLLEFEDDDGSTPLFVAVIYGYSDIVSVLLDSGADAHHVDCDSATALMHATRSETLDDMRQLLAAGVDVEVRDKTQQTALHYAADCEDIAAVRVLIVEHNANLFVVDEDGLTPIDFACDSRASGRVVHPLLEMYGNKLSQNHGPLALHELLQVARYSFAEGEEFHPPLNPLQIIVPLGKLKLKHLRTLLDTLDLELMRNRDDTGKLPVHIACQTNAPVEVLTMILELDPTALHIADFTGALPIHLICGTLTATECASVRYLVEQGGVGTLAARNRQGLLPLHVLCGSGSPPLQAVQCLIQSFSGSVAVQTDAGEYPFMMAAAAESSSASLSVVYELVRANPGLVVPR